MPLDPSILAQAKPFQAPDPLQNYAKVLQIQGAQAQQQVSQMQLEEMKQDREEMQKIQQERIAQGQDPDLRKLAASMLNTKQYFKDGIELLQKLDAQDRFNQIMGGEAALAPSNVDAAPAAPVNALAPSAGAPPVVANAPVNALRGRIPLPAPGGGGAMPAGMPSDVPPGTPMRPAMVSPGAAPMTAPGVVSAIPPQAQDILSKLKKLYELGTPQAISAAKGLEAQLKFYEAPYGEAQRLKMERERLDLTKQQAEEGKVPVGYKRTATGELEAIKGGPADAKSQIKFEQDTTAYTSASSSMDRLAVAANEVLNHPGLPGAVGLRGAIPNIPGTAAADAAALLNTLKSQVGFSVLQDMRNASKTGGALGNVSNEEGKRLEANLAALEKSQSIEQFQSNLKKIVDYTQGAKDRLKSAYELKQGQGRVPFSQTSVAAPSPSTGGANRREIAPGVFVTERQ